MIGELQNRLANAASTIRSGFGLWSVLTLGFTLGYYILLMLALMVRFADLPNYVTFYNWPKNIWTIFRSTPSLGDVPPIVAQEYLIEFGHMNHDFGNGISEWALNILPYKVLLVAFLSGLLAANILLLRVKTGCSSATRLKAGSATGLGAVFVAVTSATMSWVVCCATPTWIVGLSMLGLSVSASFWIEPAGPYLTAGGYLLLAITMLVLAGPSIVPSAKFTGEEDTFHSAKGAHA